MKAIFRLPNSKEILMIECQNSGKNWVEFHSFVKDRKIDFFAEKLENLDDKEFKNFFENIQFPENKSNFHYSTQQEYEAKILKAIEIIKENNLQKIVISRPILKEISSIDLLKTFKNLCEKYQNTLCYLLLSEDEIWLGATPEILGKFNKKTEEFFTMSLAGTLPLNENWSKKEIEEQKPVTQYISNILQKY